MREADAAARLAEAVAEQARLSDSFARAVGTGTEFSAYLRLQDSSRRVAVCERWLRRRRLSDRRLSSSQRFVATIEGGVAAPRAARAAVTTRVDGYLCSTGLGTARLLVSEVATNAVVHGGAGSGTLMEIDVSILPASVRTTVTHEGRPFACAPMRPEPADLYGRGLYLVKTLAERWGVREGTGVCSVWFDVTREGTG